MNWVSFHAHRCTHYHHFKLYKGFHAYCQDVLQVNLLATVFKMDREHSNTLTFSGNALNPEVNVRFKAPGLSARVQSRASVWHSNVIITSTAGAQGQYSHFAPQETATTGFCTLSGAAQGT